MEIIISVIGATVGFILAYYIGRHIVFKRQGEEIIRCAKQDAENIKKEKIFQAKE